MKLRRVKTIEDLTVPGCEVEEEWIDGILRGVTYKFRERVVRFSNQYGLEVARDEEPKTESKWTLKGQVQGLTVSEVFDHEYQANDRKEDLTGHLDTSKFDLVVANEEVVVE